MDNTSFIKGEEFEKFVESELFNEQEYVLVHRTNNFEQNKSRYSEDTLKPDFKFRCKKTQQEFYVEAKYRSKFNIDEKIEVISLQQLERFKKIQIIENIPIFIMVGYEGIPSNPKNLSLIHLEELLYLELYSSFLRKFKINKSIVDSKSLNLNSEIDTTFKDVDLKATKKNNYLKITLTFLSIVLLSFISFNLIKDDDESILKERTAEYYKLIENGNIDALENYISPTVINWYDKSNLTYNQIKIETINYLKKYPKSTTDIRWNTFEFQELGDDYLCTYQLIYKIKSPGRFENKIYHLKIKAIWGKDLKLKSIVEEKL